MALTASATTTRPRARATPRPRHGSRPRPGARRRGVDLFSASAACAAQRRLRQTEDLYFDGPATTSALVRRQIWELHAARPRRLALTRAAYREGDTPMRSFVTERCSTGASIRRRRSPMFRPPVPGPQPRGRRRARARRRQSLVQGMTARCSGYSDVCLRRVQRTQHFSWWMTWMLHRFPGGQDGFRPNLPRPARLRGLFGAAATTLAENYVGPQNVVRRSKDG